MTPRTALKARMPEAAGRRRQIPLASGQRAPVWRDHLPPGPRDGLPGRKAAHAPLWASTEGIDLMTDHAPEPKTPPGQVIRPPRPVPAPGRPARSPQTTGDVGDGGGAVDYSSRQPGGSYLPRPA